MDDIVAKNHDYQNAMSVDTRAIDTAGEQAASQVNAATLPVGTQTIRTDQGNQQTRVETVGTFGVLPPLVIPTDHARERMMWFKELAIATGARRNPLARFAPATETAAYKSQKDMAAAYLNDQASIVQAQQHYDLLVPQTELAARSLAKTNEIVRYTGLGDGPNPNHREQRALSKAARSVHTPLRDNGSMAQASAKLISAREKMFAAASTLATAVRSETVDKLVEQYGSAKAGREAIAEKIATAQRVVGVLANGASAVVGGAEFVHDHVLPGAAGTRARSQAEHASAVPEDMIGPKRRQRVKWPMPPGYQEPKPDGGVKDADLRDSSFERASKVAGHAAKAGKATGVVGFAMSLYYEQEVARLDSQMDVARSLLDAKADLDARTKMEAAFIAFKASQMDYKIELDAYQSTMTDRRKGMAMVGHAADRIADPSGKSSSASDAMLWTASVMETQSFVATALDFGNRARLQIEKS
jgi:hypothetical protein